MKILDLAGRRFGRLTVIHRSGTIGSFKAWLCQCDCGNAKTVSSRHLMDGHTKSCGCFRREFTRAKDTKHGLCGTPEFRSWASLRQRCMNPKNEKYPNYGGRGIRVCKRWNDFAFFLADVGPQPTRRHTIHRIDNNGNYCPSNTRWATAKEQGRNKTNSRMITAQGITHCVSEWAEILGVNSGMIYHRLARGWKPERAVLGAP